MLHQSLPPQAEPPEIAFTESALAHVAGVPLVAVPALRTTDTLELGPGAAELAEDLGVDLLGLLDALGADAETARPGTVTEVPLSAVPGTDVTSVLVVGVGDGDTTGVRRGAAGLAHRLRGRGAAVATTLHLLGEGDVLDAVVEGLVLGSFSFTLRTAGPGDTEETRVSARETTPVGRVLLAGTREPDEQALRRAVALAGAGWRSRALATVPSNIKNPPWLVDQARGAAESAGLSVRVWEEQELTEQGFGGLVGVGQASASPPRLVQLSYAPPRPRGRRAKKASVPHIVLVGKGITFDTGGLNIKPGPGMVTMKRDMSGAAVVLAVLEALAELQAPVRVTGLLCLAENAVAGNALRPGDVISHYGGRTTEVTNTDAEGRLVMADALAYAAAELEPDVLVDVATLTGAVRVALGQHLGGVFGTHDEIVEALVAAGDRAGEPLWRMPLAEEYRDTLRSPVADQANSPSGKGAAITAALFLQPFTDGLPWAHLDLASVGDSEEDDLEWTKGPTGFGPRLLLRWLADGATLPETEEAS